MSSGNKQSFECKCGSRFDSMDKLQDHIQKMKDETGFTEHGIKG
jgi:hypothetical protein